jgi:hypothetical protein
LLGASLVGPGAGDMAGMFALMIGRRMSGLAGAVLPYPTAQEAGKRAAGEFYTPKLLSAPVKRLVVAAEVPALAFPRPRAAVPAA